VIIPTVLAFVLGASVGSFLNVVIWRLPRNLSLVHPGSRCPDCAHPIPLYLNVPVLSFFILRGRCRWCGEPITWRYPAVEALTGVLFVLLVQRFPGEPVSAVTGTVFASMLVAVAFIDLDMGIVPDRVSLPGIAAGLVASLLRTDLAPWEALAGVVVCGGLFWLVIVASRGGMGGGDVKLGAMIGAFCGWRLALLACFLAVVSGGIIAAGLMVMRRKGRRDTIPFGPFLAVAAVVAYIWGDAILAWYGSLF
jgi:leader peptidase (prepilin peptidase)/N-methyltransferase